MTAAARTSCYFVLVVDGQPFAQDGTPHLPAIFRSQETALEVGYRLQVESQQRAVVLEAYADDYSFVSSRRIERPALLTAQLPRP